MAKAPPQEGPPSLPSGWSPAAVVGLGPPAPSLLLSSLPGPQQQAPLGAALLAPQAPLCHQASLEWLAPSAARRARRLLVARVSGGGAGKCLGVYQSSSDCLPGAGLPAPRRLEFPPPSPPNTSPAPLPPHIISPILPSSPGPTARGHAGLHSACPTGLPLLAGTPGCNPSRPPGRGAPRPLASGRSEPGRDPKRGPGWGDCGVSESVTGSRLPP